MIYIFYGTDQNKVADEGNRIVNGLLEKKPDAIVVNFSEITPDFVSEHTQSQGLFNSKYILRGRNVFKEDFDIKLLKEIKESENVFIFMEEKLPKGMEKYADKIKEFSVVKNEYNPFVLTNYLNNREKLWLEYHKAKKKGVSDEQIQGMLFWKAKASKPELMESLVEVFHEARRGGDMELLLERWILKN